MLVYSQLVMAIIEPQSTKQMKSDLIAFLQREDVEISEYSITPRIRNIDKSTKESQWIEQEYTGFINIEIEVYKPVYELP